MPSNVMTRREWIATVAGSAALGLVGPVTIGVASSSPHPHPAIPCRVLDRQIDAAIALVVGEAPTSMRRALTASAVERFGTVGAIGPSVPEMVRAVQRSLVRVDEPPEVDRAPDPRRGTTRR